MLPNEVDETVVLSPFVPLGLASQTRLKALINSARNCNLVILSVDRLQHKINLVRIKSLSSALQPQSSADGGSRLW